MSQDSARGGSSSLSQASIKENPRQESSEDFSPEWCQKLLNDPTYKQTGPSTRAHVGKVQTHGESYMSLMGRTLFTDDTIRAIKFLHKPGDKIKGTTGELLALVSLGGEMCSHAGVLHGGLCTTIFDEVAGGLAVRESEDNLMAANFNVNLRKPVQAPGLILVKAWIERPPEGRKTWVKGIIEQDGVKCFDGEGLWLNMSKKSKL